MTLPNHRITGTIDFAAAETNGGVYTVSLGASDGRGGTAGTTFQWSVADTNRAPTLTSPGNQTTAEGATVALQLVAADPDGDPLRFAVSGLPAGLTADAQTGMIAGTIGFGAAETNGGVYTVTASVTDGKGGSASQTFAWTVRDTPQVPVAKDDSYKVPKNGVLHVDAANGVLANDTDPNGAPLVAVLGTGPAHGTLVLHATGAFVYTPDDGFVGVDSFTYQAREDQPNGGGSLFVSVFLQAAPKKHESKPGLIGLYYNDGIFDHISGTAPATRVDGKIDFVFKDKDSKIVDKTPDKIGGAAQSQFSVVWQGMIEPPKTGFYTFFAEADAGVRLYINNELLIDNFRAHALKEDKAVKPISLEAGKKYCIVMEYFEDTAGGAEAHLRWTANSKEDGAGDELVKKDIGNRSASGEQ